MKSPLFSIPIYKGESATSANTVELDFGREILPADLSLIFSQKRTKVIADLAEMYIYIKPIITKTKLSNVSFIATKVQEHVKKEYFSGVSKIRGSVRFFFKKLKGELVVSQEIIDKNKCLTAISNGSKKLWSIPRKFRDETMCLAAIKIDASALKSVPRDLLNSDRILSAAVEKDYKMLKLVPESNRTSAICLIAVKKNYKMLKLVPEQKRSLEICLVAVEKDYKMLKLVPKKLKTEVNNYIKVTENVSTFKDLTDDEKTEKICLQAIKCNRSEDGSIGERKSILEQIPEKSRTYNICLASVEKENLTLQFVPKDLQEYKKICTDLIDKDCTNIQYMDKKSEHFSELCESAIEKYLEAPRCLDVAYLSYGRTYEERILQNLGMKEPDQNKPDQLYTNLLGIAKRKIEVRKENINLRKELNNKNLTDLELETFKEIREKATNNFYELPKIFKELLKINNIPTNIAYTKICKSALEKGAAPNVVTKTEWTVLNRFSSYQYFEQDKTMCDVAVDLDSLTLQHVQDNLKTQKMCDAAVTEEPSMMKHVPDDLKTQEMCNAAVTEDPSMMKHVPAKFQNVNMCQNAVKNNYTMIQYMRFSPDENNENKLLTKDEYINICVTTIKENIKALQNIEINEKSTVGEIGCSKKVYEEICTQVIADKQKLSDKGEILENVNFSSISEPETFCLGIIKSNIEMIKHIPTRLGNHINICATAIKKNPEKMTGILAFLKDDKHYIEICVNVIKENPTGMQGILAFLKDDKHYIEICTQLINIQSNTLITPTLLQLIPINDNKTKEIYLVAIKKSSQAITYIPKEYILNNTTDYTEICNEAFNDDDLTLSDIPQDDQNKIMCEVAVSKSYLNLEHVRDNLKTQEMCDAAVDKDSSDNMSGPILEFVPTKFRNKTIYLAAVTKNNYAIMHIPKEYIADNPNDYTELCKEAFKNGALKLRDILQNDRNKIMCEVAVSKSYLNLEDVTYNNEESGEYKAMCLIAVEQNNKAITYILEEYIADNPNDYTEICKEAFKDNTFKLENIPSIFQNNIMCNIAIDKKVSDFKYVADKLKTKSICQKAVEKDYLILEYITPNQFKKESTQISKEDYTTLCVSTINGKKPDDTSEILNAIPIGNRDHTICSAAWAKVKNNKIGLANVQKAIPKQFQESITGSITNK